VVSTNGFIGMGNALPVAKLDVYAPAANNEVIAARFNNLSNLSPATKVSIELIPDYGAAKLVAGRYINSASGGNLDIQTARYGGGAYASTMFLDCTGNVGIGTTAPAVRLQTAGSYGLPAASGTVQNGSFRVSGTTGGAMLGNVLDFGVNNASPYQTWLQSTNKDSLDTQYSLLLNPNGGNVGIGTTNPGSILDVKGGTGLLDNGITVRDENSAIAGILYGGNGRGYMQLRNAGSAMIEFNAYVNAKSYINNAGGCFGIGTTNPVHPLMIVSNDNTRYSSAIYNTHSSGYGFSVSAGSASGGTIAEFRDKDTNSKLLIKGDGNVGIGTTAPTTKTDIWGGLRLRQDDGSNSAASLIELGNRRATWGYGINFNCYYDGVWRYRTSDYAGSISFDANGNIFIGTISAKGTTDNPVVMADGAGGITIKNGNNVGIGTSTPAAKLDVNGNVSVNGTIKSQGLVGEVIPINLTGITAGNWFNINEYDFDGFTGIVTIYFFPHLQEYGHQIAASSFVNLITANNEYPTYPGIRSKGIHGTTVSEELYVMESYHTTPISGSYHTKMRFSNRDAGLGTNNPTNLQIKVDRIDSITLHNPYILIKRL
jgi:hypothetical protein